MRSKTDIATIQYPEEKKKYPERHRGLHRLMLRDDGQTRCVACMMCPTACPAHCITIVPEETPDGRIEKRPKIFEIDELRCVVCGLCAEACPCDAIRMDSGEHAHPTYRRVDGILDKEELMSRGTTSTAVQGGVGGLLAAAVRHFGSTARIVAVEPLDADCLRESIASPDGSPQTAKGSQNSIMQGLNCGEESLTAWPIVRRGVDLFVAIDDGLAVEAVQLLRPIDSGESGAAGLAGLIAICRNPELRAALNLTKEARVLVINSESALTALGESPKKIP